MTSVSLPRTGRRARGTTKAPLSESSRRITMLLTITSSRILQSFCSILVTGVFLCQIQAQAPKTLLRGKALDPAGASIAGARITVVLEGRATGLSVVSDQSGEFSLPLEPGAYTIKFTAQGFREAARTVIVKDTSSEFLEVTLQIAAQRDTVVVTDTNTYQAPLITSGTRTLTPLRDVPQSISVVTREQIKDQ